MSVDKTVTLGNMDVKSKFSQDVKKITSAASRLKIHSKRSKTEKKDKSIAAPTTTTINNKLDERVRAKQQEADEEKRVADVKYMVQVKKETLPSTKKVIVQQKPAQLEKKWTLADLMHCLGTYVNHQCRGLLSRPTASEVGMWVRGTDKALQLNGWTINSFVLESHLVFTYCLLQLAFERLNFNIRTLTDAKEIVLMCLYISYTYNANEISYPLRPFLVKQDRVAFWSKCTELSFAGSRTMLTLNRDRSYYKERLTQLKGFLPIVTFH